MFKCNKQISQVARRWQSLTTAVKWRRWHRYGCTELAEVYNNPEQRKTKGEWEKRGREGWQREVVLLVLLQKMKTKGRDKGCTEREADCKNQGTANNKLELLVFMFPARSRLDTDQTPCWESPSSIPASPGVFDVFDVERFCVNTVHSTPLISWTSGLQLSCENFLGHRDKNLQVTVEYFSMAV